jgi:hypothetical protein
VASESGGWYTRTNITLTIGARDLVKNIQCHAVNQQIGETRVQSHTINVLCKFIIRLPNNYNALHITYRTVRAAKACTVAMF